MVKPFLPNWHIPSWRGKETPRTKKDNKTCKTQETHKTYQIHKIAPQGCKIVKKKIPSEEDCIIGCAGNSRNTAFMSYPPHRGDATAFELLMPNKLITPS